MKMNPKDTRMEKHIDSLLTRYPCFAGIRKDIMDAYFVLENCFEHEGKLLIAGNGGSAADAEHIAGELMKRFKIPRPVSTDFSIKLKEIDVQRGSILSQNLEKGFMTIPLTGQDALSTAYLNDVGGSCIFAQKVYGFGHAGDVFLGISTSGNSENIIVACITAKALGMKTIGLTGQTGGELAKYADICIKAPATDTFIIQEMHLPIYHCLCLMIEEHFFG